MFAEFRHQGRPLLHQIWLGGDAHGRLDNRANLWWSDVAMHSAWSLCESNRSITDGKLTQIAAGKAMNQPRPHRRTTPPVRTNVPVALNSFVGRRLEWAQVTQLLVSARLVTVVGAGGSGKTRLAQQIAGELAGQLADGAYWVELGRLADPALVASVVAKAAGVAERPDRPMADQLLDDL
jgi:hypothetical protein